MQLINRRGDISLPKPNTNTYQVLLDLTPQESKLPMPYVWKLLLWLRFER